MYTISLNILDLQDGYHALVDVKILEQTFKLVVDTGASKTVLDKNTLLESGIQKDQFENTDILSSGLGTNNMQSFKLKLPYLQIGEWRKENFEVAVLDLATINYAYSQMGLPSVIGVLGGDILVHYSAKIDYAKETIKLNKTKKAKKLPAKKLTLNADT